MKLKLILFLILFFSTFSFANLEKSVVRISSNLLLYDYSKPWKEAKRRSVVGSGAIIENQYILTSAHVVANATTIQVRKSNSFKNFYAKIKYISHQADLALLEIYDKSFFKDTKALKLNFDSKTFDKVKIAGYPLSRNKLLVKSGVITKIKYDTYSYSSEELLSLKLNIDAKEGNSGGPILNSKDQIVGIAMQIPKAYKNSAYAVPSFIINSFLDDIKDKKIDGFHSNYNSYQYLENETLQEYYKLGKKGLLVNEIDMQERQLRVNDIILKIENQELSNIKKEKVYLKFHRKSVGNSLKLTVFRDSKIIDIDYKLNYSKKLIQQEFVSKPRYFIFAGLVFTPITRNYLKKIGMSEYEIDMLFYEQKRSLELEEKVAWIDSKFKHKINKGYNSKVEIVDRVNNIKVKNFKHLVLLIDTSKEKYIVIDFIKKQRVILDKEEAIKSFKKIKKDYKIFSDRELSQ